MPLLNIAENLKIGTTQVLRVMNRLEQVWPPLLCITFTDDFERLLLGPTWTDGPVFDFGSFTPVIENAIDAGAYVAGENDEPAPVTVLGTIRTTARYPGDQFVEATVGNFFQGHDPCMGEQYQWVEGEMWLFTQIASDSNACLGVYVIIQVNQGPGDTGGCYMQIISVAPDGTRDYFGDGTFFPLIDWQTNPDYTIRLETTAAGHCKALFEGRVVVEDDVVPIGGPHVGLAQQWSRTDYAPAPVSFDDEFDRADGPVGPDWIAVTENGNYDWVEVPLSIQSGAAIGVDGTGALPEEFSGGMWHTEMSGDQYIEVCVTGLQYRSNYPIEQRKHGQIRLFCQANTADPAKEELWVEWSDDDAVGGQRRMDCYPVLSDGTYHDESTFFQSLSPWAPALSDPTACIKLEALADGTRRVYFTLGTTGAVDLIGEGMAPLNNVGPYVGFRMFWWRGTGEGGTSPRVLWAHGGEIAACESVPNTGTSPRFEEVTGGQLCVEPCGECILDVMGAAAWQGLMGTDGTSGTIEKLLAYDAAGDFYYQTIGNMAGNIWPEMVMPPVSVEATFGNIGNVSTPTPADPDITDYCSVELWRRDNFQYGDGLRVVIQVWDAGFAYDDTPFPPGWYWWIEWYDDVVAHDYIYEFYPDDNVLGRPGLGGDEFTVHLQVDAAGEVIFSVDGVEYHRVTIDAALLPTGPGRFGFWMDRGSGGFVTVPPPDDAPRGSAVCMSLNPCP